MPHRKKILDPSQPPIKQYFKPMNYWSDQSILAHLDPTFRYQAIQLRQYLERTYSTWVYLETYNGYCYYRNADFTEYNAFKPTVDFRGERVGKLMVDDDYFIHGLYVNQGHWRKGIGTKLISLANATMGRTTRGEPRLLVLIGRLAQHGRAYPQEYQLTEDGWHLIRACREKGILQADQLIGTTPDQSPSSSQEGSYYQY